MRLLDLGDIALVLWAVPAIAAPVLYFLVRDSRGRRGVWRRDPVGMHLMAFMSAYAYLGVLGLIRLVTDGGLWFQAMRAVGFVALIVVTWWRLALIWQAWRENRRNYPPGR